MVSEIKMLNRNEKDTVYIRQDQNGNQEQRRDIRQIFDEQLLDSE